VLAKPDLGLRGCPRLSCRAAGPVPGSRRFEWGEFDWRGHHADGSDFAMCRITILTIRNDEIVEGRLYIESVDHNGDSIEASVEHLQQAEPTAARSAK
jgi:hypothetical protein